MMPQSIAADGAPDDRWYSWLLQTRHGGDAAYAVALAPLLADIRDRLLDHARLEAGQSIADIGCGDGLAGFDALERQPLSAVTFVDISPALVAHVRAEAERRGFAGRCGFVIASAQALTALPDASFDVVLVRAVLAYLSNRAAAIAEFARILRPGGRISIVDPIFADRAFAIAGMGRALESEKDNPAAPLLELLHRCRAAQFPATVEAIQANPLTNYNERDLLRLLESAGFTDLHVRLHIDNVPALPMSWPAFLAGSPYAGAPTVAQVLAAHFTPAERAQFEQWVRAAVESGSMSERNVNAYLFGSKPE